MSQLISPTELNAKLDDPNLRILDCRSDLQDRTKSRLLYAEGHIPGAIFADLETELSGPIIPGKTGRHPLPAEADFETTLRHWGIESNSPVVVYDDRNSMFAVRAWWLLKWAGVTNVKVLNGGFQHWLTTGGLPETEVRLPTASQITINVQKDWTVTADDLIDLPNDTLLLDARAVNRYSGETEPLDPKAGHIPGAWNADFGKNLMPDGLFKSKTELKTRFQTSAEKSTVCYCGSGVTACHNILAMVEAGFAMPKLYPGSWSEWVTDDQRPIATGQEGELL